MSDRVCFAVLLTAVRVSSSLRATVFEV